MTKDTLPSPVSVPEGDARALANALADEIVIHDRGSQIDVWIHENGVALITAALLSAESRGRPQWQDIATAPKDGTPILVAWAGRRFHPFIVHWEDAHQWCTLLPTFGVHEQPAPTHWQPLPAPPSLSSLEEG